MANTLLTIGMITNEALVVLENELTFTRNVNRQYDSQFGKVGAKIGDTLNVRKPVRYIGRRTPTLNVESTVETSVPLTLTTQYGTDMSFTSAELKLSIDEFRDRIIKPAVANIANMIDYDGLQQYLNIYNAVGTPGTPVTALSTFLSAKAKLNYEAAPMNDRNVVIDPTTEASIVNALTTLFNPNKQISDQYIKGSMGTAVGFDWYMDQNVAMHTFGTYAANVVGGAVTVNGAIASGTTSVVTAGWTSADQLNLGDIVTFSGVYAVNPQSRASTGALRQFVITAQPSAASGGGAMTFSIAPTPQFSGAQQNVTSATGTIATGATVLVFSPSAKVSPQSLAFQKDAFSFATVELPALPGVETSIATSKQLGMSIRLTRGADMVNDRAINRLDLLGGWVTLRPELAVRIAG